MKYMQAWEEKVLERQKGKRELLRKMNHKMSMEEIADVLDMDVSRGNISSRNHMTQKIELKNNQ